ncbi:MAG: hypothetical protein HQ510_04100 [Candidatus Marinimicrobia bacterium]|nr:hypothetical protein [Candidatus Neomarinimicrobiota bacterium]
MKFFQMLFLCFTGFLLPQTSIVVLTGSDTNDNVILNWQYNGDQEFQGFLIHQNVDLPCGENQFQDCSGMCLNEGYLAWMGDNFCDSCAPDFFCHKFDWDFGDCESDVEKSGSKLRTLHNSRDIFQNYSIVGASQDTTQLIYQSVESCFIVSTFMGTSSPPFEIEILQSSNTVCIGDCPQEPTGDVNGDMVINVLDIVRLVYIIISLDDPIVFEEYCASDLNNDALINVLDIVLILNIILGI